MSLYKNKNKAYFNGPSLEPIPSCVMLLLVQLLSCVDSFDPMNCSLPGSSVHRVLQARILEWVAIPFSRGSSQIRDQTFVSCTGRWILYY